MYASGVFGEPNLQDLYLTDVSGNFIAQLTYDTKFGYVFDWSPDGQYIAFDSKSSGNWDIWRAKIVIVPSFRLNLSPNSGFAATTVVGSGFSPNFRMSVTWGNTQIPTVPNILTTDANGNFTAIISVPTQNTPGTHTVKATDASGIEASATFTVIDMTGPQGQKVDKGDKGDTGAQGPIGPPGEGREVSIIVVAFTTGASILAICFATIALLKKKT